ncbi:MAG: 50S ribosomal protein L11 methyltransferase [Clostridia bacterium]|nr:50S ribosomal protein L11 methyltransferase [Clostridia bacterium]
MKYLEYSVACLPGTADLLCQELEEVGLSGFVVEDETEFLHFLEQNRPFWDFVDEDLSQSMKDLYRVRFYVETTPQGKALGQAAEDRLCLLRRQDGFGALPCSCAVVDDEDWQDNWKQYFRPFPSGEKLYVQPAWDDSPTPSDRIVLRSDAGMVFGSGTHESTQMCLRLLEEAVKGGELMLDLGCGSGILAVASLLLGAERAIGIDIDENAPRIARENMCLNGLDPERLQVLWGNAVTDKDCRDVLFRHRYPLIAANIVADVILALAPTASELLEEDGFFLVSGIIDERHEEVLEGLKASGFVPHRMLTENGWYAFLLKKHA